MMGHGSQHIVPEIRRESAQCDAVNRNQERSQSVKGKAGNHCLQCNDL